MGTNDAYLASKTRLFYGGSGFIADLSGFAASAGLTGRSVAEPVTVLGSTETEVDVLRAGHTVRPGALYAGAEVDKLKANSEGIVCLLFDDSKDGQAFPCVVNGLGRGANVERLVIRNITFVQAGQFVDATAVSGKTRLVTWADGANVSGIDVDTGDVGYLGVTKGKGAFSGAVTLTTTDVGIFDASGLKDGTLTTPSGTDGFLIIGKPGTVS